MDNLNEEIDLVLAESLLEIDFKNIQVDKTDGDEQLEKGEKLHYTKSMVKKRGKIYWRVIEKPTGTIIKDYFFEKDARALVRFQNKHRVWEVNGGIPHFLCSYKD